MLVGQRFRCLLLIFTNRARISFNKVINPRPRSRIIIQHVSRLIVTARLLSLCKACDFVSLNRSFDLSCRRLRSFCVFAEFIFIVKRSYVGLPVHASC